MTKEIERKKIDKWDAIIYFDAYEHQYTISYDGEGGTVVSAPSQLSAEAKFREAMSVAEAAQKLLQFNKNSKP